MTPACNGSNPFSIKKNRTPKGDGNQNGDTQLVKTVSWIKKNRTPKGDGNGQSEKLKADRIT